MRAVNCAALRFSEPLLVTVPKVLVDIHPAWRSYEYFVYNEQVIIVDPHDWHIVEVIVLS